MTESVNILVVDDHADIRELIKRFLDQHCFNTFTACDGDEMRAILSDVAKRRRIINLSQTEREW